MTGAALRKLFLAIDASARAAIRCIDDNGTGIALVVDSEGRLVGTVTDGDIRRAMLADVDIDGPVTVLLDRQLQLDENRPIPLTAPLGATDGELIDLMRLYDVRHIPVVDAERRVQRLVLLRDLVESAEAPLRAVVMAGGFGTRLGELTADTPKPMLPVGNRPLLERIISQLREAGIRHVNLTTHFRADAIASYFGDGHAFGVEIAYVSEEQPLGTAGALGLLDADGPLLVMNGDILTGVDFRALHAFHSEHDADMTVAVRPYEVRVPYGILELDGARVAEIAEKPLVRGFVNAGIYLLEATAYRSIPRGERFDMPDLIRRLVAEDRRVVGFPLREYWLDIGRVPDYEQALADVERLA